MTLNPDPYLEAGMILQVPMRIPPLHFFRSPRTELNLPVQRQEGDRVLRSRVEEAILACLLFRLNLGSSSQNNRTANSLTQKPSHRYTSYP